MKSMLQYLWESIEWFPSYYFIERINVIYNLNLIEERADTTVRSFLCEHADRWWRKETRRERNERRVIFFSKNCIRSVCNLDRPKNIAIV